MKYKIIFVLFVIALISSVLLVFNGNGQYCEIDEIQETGNCTKVQTTVYASTLGIKNYVYGIIIFGLMSLLIYSHIRSPTKYKKLVINTGVLIGAVIAIYFLYLQQFVIKSYCTYCTVVDVCMLAAFLVLFLTRRKKWHLR